MYNSVCVSWSMCMDGSGWVGGWVVKLNCCQLVVSISFVCWFVVIVDDLPFNVARLIRVRLEGSGRRRQRPRRRTGWALPARALTTTTGLAGQPIAAPTTTAAGSRQNVFTRSATTGRWRWSVVVVTALLQGLVAAHAAALPHQVTQSVGHHFLGAVDAERVLILATETHFALATFTPHNNRPIL